MSIKKILKRVIITLVLIPVLLLGVLVLYVQNNQSDIVKDQITALNKDHKGLINVGESELALFENFPYVSIKVDSVAIFESKKENADLIMDVRDVYIGFDLWDIINGNYDIQSLVVEDGVFNIIIHEDNSTNIQNSLVSSTEEKETTSTSFNLRKVVLKNIDIHTLDEVTNTDVEKFIYEGVGGFSREAGMISGHIDVDFELNVIRDRDTTFFNKKDFELHTDVVFNEETGVLDIQPSGIVMENGDFELEGSIDVFNDVDMDLSVKGTKSNFDLLMSFAPPEVIPVLEKYKNAGEIYFNASIKGVSNNGEMPFINASFGANKAFLENIKKGKKIGNVGFQGYFSNGENRNASTMEFSLTNMTASLEKGEFKGALLVKNFESPEVDMQINSNFNLDFIVDFFELEEMQNASGQVFLKMNFHDIVDVDQPEKTLQKLKQAYFAELQIKNLSVVTDEFPQPIKKLNAHLVMEDKEVKLHQFDLLIGESDLSINGFISNLPAIVHHTDIPVETHLNIASDYIDVTELTRFSKQDSIITGYNEQIKNLSLGFSFKASAKDFTESEYLPKGEFFIDSLYVDLKHYPHTLKDFQADILIDDKDLKIIDFKGYVDDSDFQFKGLVHAYSFWMRPELNGDVDLDIDFTSSKLRLEDLFSYKGENYVPEEYRHEVFDGLAVHFLSSMHYKDSALYSIDLNLDKLDAQMKLHSQRFKNFKGNFHYEDEHVVVKDFNGEIGKTNFNLDIDYYFGNNQKVKKRDNSLVIHANYIDYDALFNFNDEPVSKDKIATTTMAKVNQHAEAFNLYELPFSQMQIKADIDHFIYHRLDLQDIKADLRTTSDHFIYVDTLSMKAADGTVQLTGYFNGSDPKHIYFRPDLILESVDLDQLLFKFENFGQDHLVSENLQGKLNSHIKGKIRVYPDLVPDLDQSNVEIDVKVLNGRLKNYDPMLALSDYMGDKNLRNIRFDTLQNTIDIKKGRINIPSMTIESTLGHMELSGTHDSHQNIDYYVKVPWKTVRKAAWQKLFGRRKDTLASLEVTQEDKIIEVDASKKTRYLNLKIQGNIDDYKISLGKKKG